jgi:hypothetical protein
VVARVAAGSVDLYTASSDLLERTLSRKSPSEFPSEKVCNVTSTGSGSSEQG